MCNCSTSGRALGAQPSTTVWSHSHHVPHHPACQGLLTISTSLFSFPAGKETLLVTTIVHLVMSCTPLMLATEMCGTYGFLSISISVIPHYATWPRGNTTYCEPILFTYSHILHIVQQDVYFHRSTTSQTHFLSTSPLTVSLTTLVTLPPGTSHPHTPSPSPSPSLQSSSDHSMPDYSSTF